METVMPAKSMADSADRFCSASAAFLPPRRRTSWWYIVPTLPRFLTPRPSRSRIHPPFLFPCPLRPSPSLPLSVRLSPARSLPPILLLSLCSSPAVVSLLLRVCAPLPFCRVCVRVCRDPSICPSLYLRSRVPLASGSCKRMGLPSPPSSRFTHSGKWITLAHVLSYAALYEGIRRATKGACSGIGISSLAAPLIEKARSKISGREDQRLLVEKSSTRALMFFV